MHGSCTACCKPQETQSQCSTLEAVALALASNVHLLALLEHLHEVELLPWLVALCIENLHSAASDGQMPEQ